MAPRLIGTFRQWRFGEGKIITRFLSLLAFANLKKGSGGGGAARVVKERRLLCSPRGVTLLVDASMRRRLRQLIGLEKLGFFVQFFFVVAEGEKAIFGRCASFLPAVYVSFFSPLFFILFFISSAFLFLYFIFQILY